MMWFRIARFTLTAIAGIVLFTGNVSLAETGVTIESIEESALDSLLKDRGNRLVINFMAAWCGPCIDELPTLNNLHNKYEKQLLKMW